MSASLMTQIISIQHEMQDQPSFSNPKQKKFKLDNRFTNFPIFNLDEFCFLGLLGKYSKFSYLEVSVSLDLNWIAQFEIYSRLVSLFSQYCI